MEKKMRMGLERASLLRMVLILALGGALVQRAPRRCQGEAAAPLRGAGELVYTESAENVMLSNGRLERCGARGYWDMHWEYGSYITGTDYNGKCRFGDNDGAAWTTADGAGGGDQLLGVTFRQEPSSAGQARRHRVPPLMQLTELRLRFMPTRLDISKHRSAALAFKEARMLTRPQNKSLLFEVDHNKANIGVWIISPHKWEYLAGGPNKQELTVQTGPNLLAMLHSCHYGTPAIPLEGSEQWAKAFGPFLLYVNHARDIKSLIDDAKARAALETASWPYPWVPFPEYRKPEQRGTVTGRVVKLGRYQHGPATWVGLTDALSPISNWEDEVKGHQFWNVTNAEGEFTLYNVNPGTYLLQSLVEGFLVDSSVLQTVTVKAGWVSSVGEIVLRPKQKGPTVWEIGQPDRSAAEFLIPDLDKSRDSSDASSTGGSGSGALKDGFRHYGVWDKFVELYPMADPVFVVGQSDYAKDWFFAHVNRPNRTTTQREIRFRLDAVVPGDYTLRLAIAGAHQAALEIRLNNPSGSPLHDTGAFGRDNALARAGIHGHYHEFSISLSHMNFRAGLNSLFLRQRKNQNKFSYVMYDYLRLEAPLVSPGSLLASSR
ncbi:hypothetical protein AXG93_2035s1220 [Marchantia polymorpha subsp. ruderalis]|uniref:Rhamnogalacturonan endolyase n=1 Tax=Marchantia polymorpha subsp. ruderalis TaxID=1480154 RepID=A0A176VP98_MARPO|nr:hypothetical protein AXG93_2035s1220 [Marchantia polymorpha subsp. ruderalis]